MGVKFINNIELEQANHIQFKTAAGSNAGKIDQNGNDLVLSNSAGDVMLGDGASDVYIGDGTNSVDILFHNLYIVLLQLFLLFPKLLEQL